MKPEVYSNNSLCEQMKAYAKTASDEILNEFAKEMQDIITEHEDNIEMHKSSPIICPNRDFSVNNSMAQINKNKELLKVINAEIQSRTF